MQVKLLIVGGRVLDGAGNPWVAQDIGISDDTIVFLGDARAAAIRARETLDVRGHLVNPGFWDVHSHANFDNAQGRQALPQLYQGITTVLLGVDGGGASNVREIHEAYRANGIAVNALRYVGHAAARRAVMGSVDREPAADELERMKTHIASFFL